ncbi:MAG: Glu/Leu/Phe/Val family dehydrogenase [Solirubrobacteraceae bacterium]
MSEELGSPLVSLDHEALVVRRGARSGVYTIVAVHSTVLGPALGGCRMTSYASAAEAVRDALRLARGMTYKSAAAGLPLGGGKAVIAIEPGVDRDSMLLDMADNVESLDGLYITAEDVGTHADDMELIHTRTSHVVGLPREKGGVGDPSPATAVGVEAAMAACIGKRFGSEDFADRSVAIVGAGSVGEALARSLAGKGAKLIIADINEAKRALAEELHARWSDPESAMIADVEVLAPCALGGVLDEATIPALRCQIVCGCANNQLSREELADDLQQRNIIYAPDFIANAGGIIYAAEEHALTRDPDRVEERVKGIHDVIAEILEQSESTGRTPLVAAYAVAARRLEAGGKASRA